MQSAALIALLVVTCARSAAAFTWEACDAATAPFKPSEVVLLPDPPVIGNQVSFTIKGSADRDVAAGSISMSVSFVGTPIYETSDDLCTKTACPIAPGPLEVKYVQDLPPIAPPGDYDVTLKARDVTNNELLCVTVHFTMVPAPSAVRAVQASSSGSGLVIGANAERERLVATSRKLLFLKL